MGQSKQGAHEGLCEMHVYIRAGTGWCVYRKLAIPYPVHKRGRDRRLLVEARSGAIAGLIQYPHKPDVLEEIRRNFSPEAAKEFIPPLQELGRFLLRRDWWIDVRGEDAGCRRSWQFVSSQEVADELQSIFPDQPPFKNTEMADLAANAGKIA